RAAPPVGHPAVPRALALLAHPEAPPGGTARRVVDLRGPHGRAGQLHVGGPVGGGQRLLPGAGHGVRDAHHVYSGEARVELRRGLRAAVLAFPGAAGGAGRAVPVVGAVPVDADALGAAVRAGAGVSPATAAAAATPAVLAAGRAGRAGRAVGVAHAVGVGVAE